MTIPKDKTAGKTSIPSRRIARERVMQTLYASMVDEGDFTFLCHQIILNDEVLDETAKQFAIELATHSRDHWKACEKMLQSKSAHWDIDRLAMIDRAILHMAVTELMHMKDIPPKVTIDEAIEIAKRYSTSESGRFVNGILDAILADLRAEGALSKRGRGLREG
jgi:N utilization substance protein B